jgi:hypothetical protein
MRFSLICGIAFCVYTLSTYVWFWYRICPWCHLFDTRACPCGYGKISARFTGAREQGDFRRHFSRNIIYLFPAWFVPLGLGIAGLILEWSLYYLILLSAFGIIGFLIVPFISKIATCKDCPSRSQCPWMAGKAKSGNQGAKYA